MAGGLAAYIYVSLLTVRALHGAAPATAPASQPSGISSADIFADLLGRVVGVAVILIMVLRGFQHARKLGFSFRGFLPGFGAGLFSLLIVLPLMFVVLVVVARMMNPAGQYIHPYLKQLGEASGSRQRAMIFFSILLAAPVSEEIFFRGCLQTLLTGWFRRRNDPRFATACRWSAVVLTSLLFAMAHGDWWARPPIFVLSLCLGYAYERTGNLWTSITIHALFNAAQAAIFFEFVAHF
jgi:hypothetical protein